jgi:hypothetical protein
MMEKSKKNKGKLSSKLDKGFDEIKKNPKLKPANKKAEKNWKNSLFNDEEEDFFKHQFEDLPEEEDEID